jgi:F0F1-type ATP synthase assembly protein I
MTDKHKAAAYQQFSTITSALMGPIFMGGMIGYGVSRYTTFSFGLEVGVILGSVIGMILLIREVSKLS